MSRARIPVQRRQLDAEDHAHIRRCLVRRVNAQRVLIVVLLLFGLPLLTLGPALVAGIFWACEGPGLSFNTLFWRCTWIMTPLLFFLEINSRGRSAEQAVVAAEGVHPRVRVFSGYAGAQMVLLVIFCLLGHGLVLGAVRRIRGQIANRKAPLDRCTELAGQLLTAGFGVDIFALAKPGEPFEEVLAAIEYLTHYDWAGANAQGDKVWILSDVKKKLTREPVQ